ncbi:Uncharacterized protein Rs2_37114 [Raphanus sativus]|nr:Uncharacterized protein Rs2_37114 [Raphanus sativus]
MVFINTQLGTSSVDETIRSSASPILIYIELSDSSDSGLESNLQLILLLAAAMNQGQVSESGEPELESSHPQAMDAEISPEADTNPEADVLATPTIAVDAHILSLMFNIFVGKLIGHKKGFDQMVGGGGGFLPWASFFF